MSKVSAHFKVKNPQVFIDFFKALNTQVICIIPCKTLSSKSNIRNYFLALTGNCIFFLRQQAVNSKISIFRTIPIIRIKEISKSEIWYIIHTYDGQQIRIQTPYINYLVYDLTFYLKRLRFDFPKKRELTLNGVKLVKPINITAQPPNITILRYEAEIMNNNSKISIDFGANLLEFEASSRCYFFIPKECAAIESPRIISTPLIGEKSLSALAFDGVGPRIICKAIRTFLKYTKSLTTIILENYDDLQFEQFDFQSIQNPSVISWTFKNCFSNKGFENRVPLFFDEFSNYPSEIQTFHIEGFNLRKAINNFSKMLAAPNFRTLEFLIIRNAKLPKKKDGGYFASYKKIISSIKTLYQLFAFEFTNSQNQIVFDGDFKKKFFFVKNESLISLSLSHLNLLKFKGKIQLPKNLINLEINNTVFSFEALKNILRAVSHQDNKICLSLCRMELENDKEKNNFNTYLQKCKPISNLIELDWSGNPITSDFVNVFCRVFLPLKTIKCFSYNGTLTSELVPAFLMVCDHLKNGNLWGLEIAGGNNPENRLNHELYTVIKGISSLTSLEHLNISSHGVDDDTVLKIINLMKNNLKMIHSLSFDDTCLSRKSIFYAVYQQLFNYFYLKSIQRPLKDIHRVFSPGDENEDLFKKFQKKFQPTKTPSDRISRVSFYYNSFEIFASFQNYYQNLSASLTIDFPIDPFWLTVLEATSAVPRSVYSKSVKNPSTSFNIHQIECIQSPYQNPSSKPPKKKFKIPNNLASFREFIPKDLQEFTSDMVDNIQTIGPNQVLEKYKSLMTPNFLLTLTRIDVISSIINKQAETEKDIIRTKARIVRPSEFVTRDAIRLFKTKCAEMVSKGQKSNKISITTINKIMEEIQLEKEEASSNSNKTSENPAFIANDIIDESTSDSSGMPEMDLILENSPYIRRDSLSEIYSTNNSNYSNSDKSSTSSKFDILQEKNYRSNKANSTNRSRREEKSDTSYSKTESEVIIFLPIIPEVQKQKAKTIEFDVISMISSIRTFPKDQVNALNSIRGVGQTLIKYTNPEGIDDDQLNIQPLPKDVSKIRIVNSQLPQFISELSSSFHSFDTPDPPQVKLMPPREVTLEKRYSSADKEKEIELPSLTVDYSEGNDLKNSSEEITIPEIRIPDMLPIDLTLHEVNISESTSSDIPIQSSHIHQHPSLGQFDLPRSLVTRNAISHMNTIGSLPIVRGNFYPIVFKPSPIISSDNFTDSEFTSKQDSENNRFEDLYGKSHLSALSRPNDAEQIGLSKQTNSNIESETESETESTPATKSESETESETEFLSEEETDIEELLDEESESTSSSIPEESMIEKTRRQIISFIRRSRMKAKEINMNKSKLNEESESSELSVFGPIDLSSSYDYSSDDETPPTPTKNKLPDIGKLEKPSNSSTNPVETSLKPILIPAPLLAPPAIPCPAPTMPRRITKAQAYARKRASSALDAFEQQDELIDTEAQRHPRRVSDLSNIALQGQIRMPANDIIITTIRKPATTAAPPLLKSNPNSPKPVIPPMIV